MGIPLRDSQIREWDWAEAWPGDFEALWLWHHFTILGPIMASEGPAQPLPSFLGPLGGLRLGSTHLPHTWARSGPGDSGSCSLVHRAGLHR